MKSASCRAKAWTCLVEPLKIAFDMRPQQLLHAVVGELRLQLGNRAFWIV